jgi:hypothetical protein
VDGSGRDGFYVRRKQSQVGLVEESQASNQYLSHCGDGGGRDGGGGGSGGKTQADALTDGRTDGRTVRGRKEGREPSYDSGGGGCVSGNQSAGALVDCDRAPSVAVAGMQRSGLAAGGASSDSAASRTKRTVASACVRACVRACLRWSAASIVLCLVARRPLLSVCMSAWLFWFAPLNTSLSFSLRRRRWILCSCAVAAA